MPVYQKITIGLQGQSINRMQGSVYLVPQCGVRYETLRYCLLFMNFFLIILTLTICSPLLISATPISIKTPNSEQSFRSSNTPSLHSPPEISLKSDLASHYYSEEQNVNSGFPLLVPFSSEVNSSNLVEQPWPNFGQFDIPISYNEKVTQALHILQTDASYIFSEWLSRMVRYRGMIESIFSRAGIPGDLVYIALIESGFNPRARSSDGRAGLWQFSQEEAKQLGLERNDEVDERYDPEKSTQAAASRFRQLYLKLGSWEYVLAAHHAGVTPVIEADNLNLWSMVLPRQTDLFVSFVMASAIITKSPGDYGFKRLGGPPLIHESVSVKKPLTLAEVAKALKVSSNQLQLLNPELRRWRASPGYNLKVPLGTKRSYNKWAGIKPSGSDFSEMVFYKVRRGDTLARIARRYGVRTGDIVAENNIRRPNRLRIGEVLTIPLYGSSIRPGSPSIYQRKPRNISIPNPSTHRTIKYQIKKGDNLATLSRRFKVSMANLQDWNKLRNPGDIIAGRSLIIYLPRAEAISKQESKDIKKKIRSRIGTKEPSVIIYTVKPGDTLWDIARAYKVTVSALRKSNGLGRRSAIHPGDRLMVGSNSSQ